MTVKDTSVCEACESLVNSGLKSCGIGIVVSIYKAGLKHLFTEEGEPSALGKTNGAERVKVEAVGLALRKRKVAQVTDSRGVYKLIIIKM